MALTNLIAGFRTSSTLGKLAVIAIPLVLMLLVGGATRSCVSSYKDAQADKKQLELKAESDAHRKRADEAEAKARALETDVKIAQLAVEAASQKVAEKQELLKQEDARATEDLQNAGQEVDAVERCRRLCARAKRLELIAKNTECGC